MKIIPYEIEQYILSHKISVFSYKEADALEELLRSLPQAWELKGQKLFFGGQGVARRVLCTTLGVRSMTTTYNIADLVKMQRSFNAFDRLMANDLLRPVAKQERDNLGSAMIALATNEIRPAKGREVKERAQEIRKWMEAGARIKPLEVE